MQIHSRIRALRSDDAPQRSTQQFMAEAELHWRERSGMAALEAELGSFSAGAALDDLPFLATLFASEDPAGAKFVTRLIAAQASALESEPLGQVVWRHQIDDTLATLVIAQSGNASLSLQAIDGTGLARKPDPQAATFFPGETWDHVIAGTADAEQVLLANDRPVSAGIAIVARKLAPGTILHRDCAREALLFRQIPTSLLTLKLQRRTGAGEVARQYRLDNGELIHQAAGTPRESRLELTAALLGRMGRSDAAPLLAAMAEEEAGASLRWQSLRECLALDTAEGFAALCRIAGRPGDPLSAPAGALRAQLLETFPQLAGIEKGKGPCPV